MFADNSTEMTLAAIHTQGRDWMTICPDSPGDFVSADFVANIFASAVAGQAAHYNMMETIQENSH